ncbi:TolC family protein [bacterium]|nr:TolC family protein [bacterium]
MKQLLPILCLFAVVSVMGCSSSHRGTTWPGKRPLGSEIENYEAPPRSHGESAPTLIEPDGELALRDVLSLALMHNPKLASASWSVRIGEARKLQAGLFPNPEVEFEVDEITGSVNNPNFDASGMAMRLSQVVEIGGKRSARKRVAESESRLAGWDYETERLAVLTDTTLRFIDVLAAQKGLQLTQEIVNLSEKTLATVAERVDAGKVSPLERTKAAVELATNKIELGKARSGLRSARKGLVSTWGSKTPRFSQAVGAMDSISEIPLFESVMALLSQNPDVARRAQEMEQRLAVFALEKVRRVPDLTLGVGLKRFEETNDHALAVGIGLELPLFDRNQGSVLEARYRLAQIRHERRSAEVRTAAALAESYETLAAARAEAIGLRDEIVPGATRAFGAAQEGYKHGKFGYIEVLDAQRTLFEARGRLLDALSQYHQSVAIVESLIGTKLDSLQHGKGRER